MTGVRLRRLRGDDAREYVRLRREMLLDTPHAFASSPEDDLASDEVETRRRLDESENAVFGAWEGETLVASAGVYRARHLKAAHRATVWGVYVSPAWRGRGVGEAVMRGAIEVARSWPGVEVLGLSASVRSLDAVRLYERMGFERWGIEPDAMRIAGESVDEVYLQLRL